MKKRWNTVSALCPPRVSMVSKLDPNFSAGHMRFRLLATPMIILDGKINFYKIPPSDFRDPARYWFLVDLQNHEIPNSKIGGDLSDTPRQSIRIRRKQLISGRIDGIWSKKYLSENPSERKLKFGIFKFSQIFVKISECWNSKNRWFRDNWGDWEFFIITYYHCDRIPSVSDKNYDMFWNWDSNSGICDWEFEEIEGNSTFWISTKTAEAQL